MKKFSLRKKFFCYFSPLLACIVLFGLYYIYVLSSIQSQLSRLHENVTPNAFAILELKELLTALDVAIKDKNLDRKLINAKLNQLRKFSQSHVDHETLNSDEDRSSHDTLHKTIRTMSLTQYVLKQSDSGWNDSDLDNVSTVIHKELSALGPILDKHLKIHLAELNRAESYVTNKYKSSRQLVLGSIIAMSLVAIVILMAMMRSVLGPVKALEEGAKQIGNGNLAYKIAVSTGDEFEYLADEFRSMAEKLAVSHAELDRKVTERTDELSQVNEGLQKEITERKTAQEEQQRAEEQVHYLSQELLRIQETERQQISLDLHDNVAQELSSLKIATDALLQSLNDDEKNKRQVMNWGNLLDRCVKTVRGISYNLRPPGLEQMGLPSAVKDYCRSFSNKTGLIIDVTSVGVDKLGLNYTYAINIYRVVQEALNNIFKHANAQKVIIKLAASYPNIIVNVEDDGCGFDVKQSYQKVQQGNHLGLLGMQERVKMLKGNLSIESQVQSGTKIFIEIPWSNKNVS